MTYQHDLRIAGVRLRILAPRKIRFPENFQPFEITDGQMPDVTVEVFFGTKTLPEHCGSICRITQCKDGEDIVRLEPALAGEPWRIGIPERMAAKVCENGNWLLYLPLERVLLHFDCVILHASAVIHEGKAFVFTAPAGTGKSTQAELWEQMFGAEILNGDKVILSCREGRIIAYGGPASGSSGIHKNSSAPVAAIFQLKQDSRNFIVSANNATGYFALYSGLVKSRNEPAFNQKLLSLTEMIIQSIPMATLHCRPEREAVECVMQWMKEKD